MADIVVLEHKELTDPNLHEPKGIAAASANSVYVCTGEGTGSWHPLTISEMNYTPQPLQTYNQSANPSVTTLNLAGAGATVDGSIIDALNFTQVNKNVKECATVCNQLNTALAIIIANYNALKANYDSLVSSLKTSGVITNGSQT